MAKRLVKWTLDKSILGVSKLAEGDAKNTPIVLEESFDLSKLYPNFLEYTDVQKQLIVYGVKQKLADSGSSEIGSVVGKVQAARDKWQELIDGKWSGTRTNATGAAEAKKLQVEMKAYTEVVSLEGLVMKRVMSGKPGFPDFTEEDQLKLDELMKAAVDIQVTQ